MEARIRQTWLERAVSVARLAAWSGVYGASWCGGPEDGRLAERRARVHGRPLIASWTKDEDGRCWYEMLVQEDPADIYHYLSHYLDRDPTLWIGGYRDTVLRVAGTPGRFTQRRWATNITKVNLRFPVRNLTVAIERGVTVGHTPEAYFVTEEPWTPAGLRYVIHRGSAMVMVRGKAMLMNEYELAEAMKEEMRESRAERMARAQAAILASHFAGGRRVSLLQGPYDGAAAGENVDLSPA